MSQHPPGLLLLEPSETAMELSYECPACRVVSHVEHVESRAQLECAACGALREVGPKAFPAARLAACAVCATEDLYIQKDFPHILGLSIVIVGIVVSSVFWAYYMPMAALAVLLATAALDLVLFYVVKDVTICYRCLSQFRGEGSNPEGRFHSFDLTVGERYRQERMRAEELRQRRQSSSPEPADGLDNANGPGGS